MTRPTVLYVISTGRSGSTILGNVLGEIDGYVHVGELRSLWSKGLVGRRPCGCGRPIVECDLWASALRGLAGDGRDLRDLAAAMHRRQREAVRLRHTRSLLSRAPIEPADPTPLGRYATTLGELYGGIARATGAGVIVDTSKRQADAALLRLVPGIDVRYVQLVRDPRAVAYSWQRHREAPGRPRQREMMRYGPFTSTRNWLTVNVAAESIRRTHGAGRSVRIRYEDFVSDPSSAVVDIARLMADERPSLPFLDDRTVTLSGNHTAGGNPDRFGSGRVTLREDDEWRARQAPSHRWIATAVALPLLGRYGYAVVPGADDRARPPVTVPDRLDGTVRRP